jgi:hypothetical protein
MRVAASLLMSVTACTPNVRPATRAIGESAPAPAPAEKLTVAPAGPAAAPDPGRSTAAPPEALPLDATWGLQYDAHVDHQALTLSYCCTKIGIANRELPSLAAGNWAIDVEHRNDAQCNHATFALVESLAPAPSSPNTWRRSASDIC